MTVRRAVLPWRRWIRPSEFDFVPLGAQNLMEIPVLGLLVMILVLPLMLLTLIAVVLAAFEMLVLVILLPFVLAWRSACHAWPVQVIDRGRVVHSETKPTFAEAGRRAAELDRQIWTGTWG